MWRNEARTLYGFFLCLLLSGSAFSAPYAALPPHSTPLF